MSVPFTILQFNTWLMEILWGVYRATDFQERLRVMPGLLAAEKADVLCLMEVWRDRDKRALTENLRELGYPHSATSRDHWWSVGDGLLFVSKHPIVSVELSKPFSKPTQFREIFARKRVMKITVDVAGVGHITICQMHLGATLFDPRTKLYDRKTRKILGTQVSEVSDFIHNRCGDDPYLFVAGDLNFHYQEYLGDRRHGTSMTEDYSKLLRCLRKADLHLKNSFLETNGLCAQDPHVPTYSQENPYVAAGESKGSPDETLDYILYRPTPDLRVVESKIVFRKLESGPPALSDHYGVKSTFAFGT